MNKNIIVSMLAAVQLFTLSPVVVNAENTNKITMDSCIIGSYYIDGSRVMKKTNINKIEISTDKSTELKRAEKDNKKEEFKIVNKWMFVHLDTTIYSEPNILSEKTGTLWQHMGVNVIEASTSWAKIEIDGEISYADITVLFDKPLKKEVKVDENKKEANINQPTSDSTTKNNEGSLVPDEKKEEGPKDIVSEETEKGKEEVEEGVVDDTKTDKIEQSKENTIIVDATDDSFGITISKSDKEAIDESLSDSSKEEILEDENSYNLTDEQLKQAENISGYFRNSMKGMEEYFLFKSAEYNVDVSVVLAIAIHETGWGSSNLAVNKNNFGGMRYNGEWLRYETKEDGLEAVIKLISRYNARGEYTPEEIGKRYCPDSPEWVTKITNLSKDIKNILNQ